VRNPSPIEYLGIEAVRAGVPRWHAALAEGKRQAPSCDRVLRSGNRCQNPAIREAASLKPPVFRCRLHMPHDVWARIDHLRRERGRMLSRSSNSLLRAKGQAILRQIEIRELLNRWKLDPGVEADMFVLSQRDRNRIEEWLARRGFCLDRLEETGRPMTPCRRGFVHLRVALHLSGRLTESLALRSVRSAIRRDVRWFAEKEAAEARLPAWDSDPDGE
jgi:hypothetical protein